MDIARVRRWYWLRRTRNKLRVRPKSPLEKLGAVLAEQGVTLVVDVGANTGQTHDRLRELGYAGRIVSIEPLPPAHAALVEKAKADPRWDVAPRMALGDAETTATIRESEAGDLSSLMDATAELHAALHRTRVVAEHETPVRRLDAVFDELVRPDETVFVKIDAQGYDLKVLEGADGVMARIAGIQVEMSLFPLYEGEPTYLEILNFLDARGFEPHILTETNFSADLRRQLQADGVFFRKGTALRVF